MLLQEERMAVVEYCKKMFAANLVIGTAGNISVCNADKTMLAISPTGVSYDVMKAEDVVVLDMAGNQVDGDLTPSSEVAFHLALSKHRPNIHAVVHTHSNYATTMACLGWELPAVHYLVGFAGSHVPLSQYDSYGTKGLSDNICQTIGEVNAVLMANHGLVAVGKNIHLAFTTAEMIEFVCRIYLQAKAVGEPVILDDREMENIVSRFSSYGQQTKK